jgi:rSAM/selenodomain-associated transferase 1
MGTRRRSVGVLVFARAPLPGRTKSRLVPTLGEWGAARLQARLTLRALRTAAEARCGPLELHATPRPRHAFFERSARAFPSTLHAQRGDDLGARMLNAFRRGLRRYRAVILIGTDCPALRPADLARAARWLAGGCDAVFAPAEDGGYALIGLRRAAPAVFAGIEWGEAGVYAATRERLAALGWRSRALRTVWDVDRPADVVRLRASRLLERRRVTARRFP